MGKSALFFATSIIPMLNAIYKGTKDTVVEPKHADVLKGFMPQANVHIIEGAGHDLTLRIPDQVANVIMTFIRPGN
jgi:pimeloyl-ACP methyl ester carboxylesterase